MAKRHITIGSEFFAKAFNDYANWHWAIMREFFQNSIDCGSDNIIVNCYDDDGKTILIVENDGDPMDEDILVGKLLSLGGSGKDFDNSVGGFGKAKEVLYFCHESYQIRTGNLTVEGSGATYDLVENGEFLHGTRSTITIGGEHAFELIRQMKRWIVFAQRKGVTFNINGDCYRASLKKGSPRRGLGFGNVYSNKSGEYVMVVRIDGMPMFTERTSFDRLVIVELEGNSAEVMTSNRDGLVRPFSGELSDFVTELAVDKRSALRNSRDVPRYTEYRGTKLCHAKSVDVAAVVDADDTGEEDEKLTEVVEVQDYPGDSPELEEELVVDDTPESGPVTGITVVESDGDIDDGAPVAEEFFGDTESTGPVHRAAAYSGGTETAPEPRRQVATIGTNFILKNETDLKIPRYYDPGSGELSSYSTKLIRFWGRIMLEMHRLFDKEGEFSIGFIFDEGEVYATEAQCEEADYGLVYYLNPCEIVEAKQTVSKSFRKRFKLTERDRFIMIGLHEFVHATGLSWHDEDYANRLTNMSAFVMRHRKRFGWCFK